MVSGPLGILIIAVFALSALGIRAINVPPEVALASTPTIILTGFIGAWNQTTNPNPTITVTEGSTVSIQLSSGDGNPHRFFVDVDNNGPTPDCPGADVCSNPFPPSITLILNVNIPPGIYTYYCSVHPTTMVGRFVVIQPPPTPAGGGHLVEM